MDFDALFQYIGEFGPYQLMVFCILVLPMILSGTYDVPFRIAWMWHWCKVPALEHLEPEYQLDIAIPYDEWGDYDLCTRYDLNFSSFSQDELLNWNRTSRYGDGTNVSTIGCTAWVYDRSEFEETAVSAYDFVCQDETLNYLPISLASIMVLIGATFWGFISDRFGRKKTLISAKLVLYVLGLTMMANAQPYGLYYAGVLIMGFGMSGVDISGFIIIMETVGPRFRGYLGMIFWCFWSAGVGMSSAFAYGIRNFRYLSMVQYSGMIPLILIWLIPDPPRWLIQKNRMKEAKAILERCARMNKKQLPENLDQMLVDIRDEELRRNKALEASKKNLTHLFRSKKMALTMAVLYFNWFANSLIYYTFALHVGELAGDIFINNAAMGLIEIPAIIIGSFLMGWRIAGRRYTLSFGMIIAGVSSIIIVPFLINDIGVGTQVFSFIGKGVIAMTYSGIYIYAAELIPTEVRTVGMGTFISASTLGGVIAPFMGPPMTAVWAPLANVIMGVVGILAGLALLYLPETLGKPMCQTVEEAEALDRSRVLKSQNKVDEWNGMTVGEKSPDVGCSYDNQGLSMDEKDAGKEVISPKTPVTETNVENGKLTSAVDQDGTAQQNGKDDTANVPGTVINSENEGVVFSGEDKVKNATQV